MSFSRQIARMMARLASGLHSQSRRLPRERQQADERGLLEWAAHYLPKHFAKPPSAMHGWLAEEVDRMRVRRGVKVSLVGPRGG
ncbi:MAG: hypothetical protein KC492_02875, partial [Myxococcales bacterium]|nr:hypothetical protein [Myxococcales bacterium]